MLKDHKLRQQLFLANDPPEIVKDLPFIYKDNISEQEIIADTIDYFTKELDSLIYPAKAYAVAIIYAKLLEKYFAVPFYESLNDKDLFYATMKCFIPYSKATKIYDSILKELKLDHLEKNNFSQVQASIESFHQEFSTNIRELKELRF